MLSDQKFTTRNQIDFFDENLMNGLSKKKAYFDQNNQLKYTLEVERKYNPHLIPPNWKTAQRHGVYNYNIITYNCKSIKLGSKKSRYK